jgi:hypothetical protein
MKITTVGLDLAKNVFHAVRVNSINEGGLYPVTEGGLDTVIDGEALKGRISAPQHFQEIK